MPRRQRRSIERLRYEISAYAVLPWETGLAAPDKTKVGKVAAVAYFLMRLFNRYSHMRSFRHFQKLDKQRAALNTIFERTNRTVKVPVQAIVPWRGKALRRYNRKQRRLARIKRENHARALRNLTPKGISLCEPIVGRGVS